MRAAIISILAVLTPATSHAAAVAGIVAVGFVATTEAAAAGFRGIGDLPGGEFESVVFGVSADGQVLVGHGRSDRGMEAIAWSDGEFNLLGDLDGGEFFSVARAASSHASIIVGAGNWTTDQQAFRWASGQLDGLGDLDGGIFGSEATSVSADGSIVVGIASVDSGVPEYPRGLEAFRWENGVMTGIGLLPGSHYSRAFGVSADGRVVVGDCSVYFENGFGNGAFRWEDGVMTGLEFGQARAVSGDGSVIAGTHSAGALRWEAGQWEYLGPEPGGETFSQPMAISGDGTVIVGWGETSEAAGTEAYIWDSIGGTRQLDDVLHDDFGISTDGWQLLQATGISADGKTIVGYGRNSNGDFEGWVANIPEPSTFVLAAIGAACIALRFRRR